VVSALLVLVQSLAGPTIVAIPKNTKGPVLEYKNFRFLKLSLESRGNRLAFHGPPVRVSMLFPNSKLRGFERAGHKLKLFWQNCDAPFEIKPTCPCKFL
jgi:hypothetical protein